MKRTSDKTEKVIEIDKMKIVSAAVILIMCVLALIGVIRFVRSLMRVSEFDVTGDSPYEVEDIVNASGIRPGDKLYEIDEDEAKRRIMAYCPYITEIEIKSRFPKTVEINVSSLTASWYIEFAGDYYALDAELRVLEETSGNQRFISGGIPKLTLPNIKEAIVGSTLLFGENESEIKYANEFMDMVKQTSFKSRLTLVDIDQRFEIYIQVDGVFDVYMGDISNTSKKLEAVEKALRSPQLENCVSAEINVVSPSEYSIKPVYDYGVDEDGTGEENASEGTQPSRG